MDDPSTSENPPTAGGANPWRWDGARWVDPATGLPFDAHLSPDGRYRWDGAAWQPVAPTGAPSGPPQMWPPGSPHPAPAAARPRGARTGALAAVVIAVVVLLGGGGALIGIHAHNQAVADAAASSSSSSAASSRSSASSASAASSASSASSASAASSASSYSASWSSSSASSASSAASSSASVAAAAKANLVTATSGVKADRGTLVYRDGFSDEFSGWDTDTTGSYVAGGYQFSAASGHVTYSPAPYQLPAAQGAFGVTAQVKSSGTSSPGFGVTCFGATATKGISYEFLVLTDGTWEVARRNHDNPTYPTLLAGGRSPVPAGAAPVTVEGACVSLTGSRSVRLLLFINGHQASDVSDNPGVAITDAWYGGIAAAGQITILATDFSVRNLDS